MQSQRGFTLLELLVALTIMATMTLGAWWALDGMARAVHLSEANSRAVSDLQTGLDQWATDLDALQGDTAMRMLQWDGQSLRLTRRASAEEPASLIVVAWALHTAPEGSMWMRWQSPTVQTRTAWASAWQAAGAWAQSNNASDTNHNVHIAPVQHWQILLLDKGSWHVPTVGIDNSAPPPDGVRLLLDVAPGHPLGGRIQRDWARPTITGTS